MKRLISSLILFCVYFAAEADTHIYSGAYAYSANILLTIDGTFPVYLLPVL